MYTTAQPIKKELAAAAVYQSLDGLVAELKRELPGISFGYIGNHENWGDDRSFCVFLPHPDRIGCYEDSVGLGPYSQLPKAVENWEQIATTVRKYYHNGSLRVKGQIL